MSRKEHLHFAASLWRATTKETDHVIDATAGAGYDAKTLSTLVPKGFLYALDIQKAATLKTAEALKDVTNKKIYHTSHVTFPEEIPEVKLVVYNLGYLPCHDKTIVTEAKTTIQSLQHALRRIQQGGAISVMCYPGHPEGALETQACKNFFYTLEPSDYAVSFHTFSKEESAPCLFFALHKK